MSRGSSAQRFSTGNRATARTGGADGWSTRVTFLLDGSGYLFAWFDARIEGLKSPGGRDDVFPCTELPTHQAIMTVKTKVNCPHCGVAIRVKPEHANKRGRCPACKEPFTIQLRDGATATVQVSGPAIAETIDYAGDERGPDIAFEIEGNLPELVPLGSLGRFQLRKLLGQGGFGRVYLAFDPQLDRLVALKVPTFESYEERKVRRFVAEAKAAARLRHPNIVPTYESGQISDQHYIASQYIAGQTLAARLAKNPPDFRQAAEWVRQLAEGLAYAHAHGIVHRDIKPANIMLDEHDVPQIMDFGLAKRLNDDAAMTIDGTVLGTPAYMAPEQARGDTANVNASSDQYSLGVVLYELLTGERPYSGPSHTVLASVLTEDPPTPRDRRPEIPRDLDAICQVAMHKQADRRYVNTSEFSQDLSRWLNETPIKARTVSLAERFMRWIKREPRVAALMVAVILLLVLGTGISTTLALRASNNLLLADLHARNLDTALKSARDEQQRANTEAARANTEAQRARAAETAAKDRETDALLARNDATKAGQLADERARRLQAVLDELKVSKEELKASIEAVEAKTTELSAAAETVSKSEIARRQSEFTSRLISAKTALKNFDGEEAQRLLSACDHTLRNDEWKQLVAQSERLRVHKIAIEGKPGTLRVTGGGKHLAYTALRWEEGQGAKSGKWVQGVGLIQLAGPARLATFRAGDIIGVAPEGVFVFDGTSIAEVSDQRTTDYFGNLAELAQFKAGSPLIGGVRNMSGTYAGQIYSLNNKIYIRSLELRGSTLRANARNVIQVQGEFEPAGIQQFVVDTSAPSSLFWDRNKKAFLIDGSEFYTSARAVSQPHLDQLPLAAINRAKYRGGHLVVPTGNMLNVYDFNKRLTSVTIPDPANVLGLSADGMYVAAAWNGELGIWNATDGTLVRSYSGTASIYDIEFQENYVYWGSEGEIVYWKLPK